MAEPITSLLASKAVAIAVDKIIDHLMRAEDVTQFALARIQTEVQALRDAYLLDALDCLRDGDLLGYKRAARAAINRNRFNAFARFLYADALLRERRWTDAITVFQECVEWYGRECPLLPEVIGTYYAGQNGNDLFLSKPSQSIDYNSTDTPLKRIALTAAGAIVAWQNLSLGFRGFTHWTTITLHKWHARPRDYEVIHEATQKPNERPIFWTTDRVLLHTLCDDGMLEAVDLRDLNYRLRLTINDARRFFGSMSDSPGLAASGATRGISVDISEERSWEESGGGQFSPGRLNVVTRVKLTSADLRGALAK